MMDKINPEKQEITGGRMKKTRYFACSFMLGICFALSSSLLFTSPGKSSDNQKLETQQMEATTSNDLDKNEPKPEHTSPTSDIFDTRQQKQWRNLARFYREYISHCTIFLSFEALFAF